MTTERITQRRSGTGTLVQPRRLQTWHIVLGILSVGVLVIGSILYPLTPLSQRNDPASPNQGVPAANAQEETPTAEPTAVPTQEPTDEILALVDENSEDTAPVEELPLSGFEAIFARVQAVEPEAYLGTSDCTTYDEDKCVTVVDFCPEGAECPHVLVIYNIYAETLQFLEEGYFETEEEALSWFSEYMSADPVRQFDNEFDFELYRNLDLDGLVDGVVLSPMAIERLKCTFREPYVYFFKAAYPITEEIFTALRGTKQAINLPDGTRDEDENLYWMPGLFMWDKGGFSLSSCG